jgi:hypothetical protein
LASPLIFFHRGSYNSNSPVTVQSNRQWKDREEQQTAINVIM